MCSLYIYTSQNLKQNFTVSQTITFFATNNYNSIFNVHKLCGTCSGVVQCIHAEKRAIDLPKGGSLCQVFLVETVQPRMFCEESLGKIKFRAFPKRVGPRILSLESVDYFGTSEHFGN